MHHRLPRFFFDVFEFVTPNSFQENWNPKELLAKEGEAMPDLPSLALHEAYLS
jgi:hypothetical protein